MTTAMKTDRKDKAYSILEWPADGGGRAASVDVCLAQQVSIGVVGVVRLGFHRTPAVFNLDGASPVDYVRVRDAA